MKRFLPLWICWEKFNETSLPEKDDFYSHLNIFKYIALRYNILKDITDADYTHAERVCKNFDIKNLGDYYDLHVQSDTLLFDDIFANFQNMCLEIYELDPTHFLSAPGLAW